MIFRNIPPLGRSQPINSIPFDDPPPAKEKRFNASDIIALADSRFLFCDNNVGNALYELKLTPKGKKTVPLIRRPIVGIRAGAVDDLEGLALAEEGEQRFIFAVSSLSLKKKKKLARSCLLRIAIEKRERLRAEIIPDFRSWVIENLPEVRESANIPDDDGGLNVEGLAWHPEDNILMLGFRMPLINDMPFIAPIRLKSASCDWSLDNLQMFRPIPLFLQDAGGQQGIRSISYDPSRRILLILTGNAISASNAPYNLYSWNGNTEGSIDHMRGIQFHPKMKVEGITYGTINNRGAIVFVDDAGGYQVLWNDDPRLR